jgi:glyoxylate reductase
MLGHRIWGKRLGFGLAVHYHNRRRVHPDIERELEATYWESLDQMLARMDIVSVNCPHTPATFHLLSARRLKLVQPHTIIVNTARGEVIDENALTRMLRNGELAGAGLDVFENEPAINPKLRDLDNARQRGITVTNTPGVLTDDTADMTMALVLATARRMGAGERMVRAGKWTGWSPTAMLGGRLLGKRMGIVGMGRIGQALARRAKGFGLSIHYHNRKRVHADIESELEATYWESLDQMLARMDIVSVNCPHTPATFHLLSARRLKLMKPTAIIVNTARGEVIDENAMVRMLKAGELAGAGLDVYEHEPQVNPKLLELDGVVLLPHMGSATLEGRIEMGEKVLINIKTFADGHKPPDRVLATMF